MAARQKVWENEKFVLQGDEKFSVALFKKIGKKGNIYLDYLMTMKKPIIILAFITYNKMELTDKLLFLSKSKGDKK